MKTLLFIFAFSLFGSFSTQAQIAKTEHSSKHLSISVSDSNDRYQFKAKYEKEYDEAIRELLIDRFGKENISSKKGWLSWLFSDSSKEEIYVIELASGQVNITLNKNRSDQHLQEKIKTTGEDIENLLSDK